MSCQASVSLIIVNWNAGDLLERCLGKILEQTVKPDQIIVVDNASSDQSLNALSGKPEITLIQMERNTGFAHANNAALELCRTEYVGLINPDAFPECDWLERLLSSAAVHPAAVAFGCRQMIADSPEYLDGCGDVYHVSGVFWREGHGRRWDGKGLLAREIFSPCAGAALYRRDALMAVGGFDDDFFCYAEDVDLGFRLRLAGYRALYVPEAVVYHVGSATTGGQQSDFSVYHGHRNLVWVYVKNMPSLLFWTLLPLHFLLNIFSLFWFMSRGQGKLIFKAKWDAIKGVPQMWRKRALIQSARIASVWQVWKAIDKRIIPGSRCRNEKR